MYNTILVEKSSMRKTPSGVSSAMMNPFQPSFSLSLKGVNEGVKEGYTLDPKWENPLFKRG